MVRLGEPSFFAKTTILEHHMVGVSGGTGSIMFRGSLCLAHHVGSLCKRQFISGTLAKMTLGLAVGMRSERLGVLLCIVCLFCDTSFDIKVCKL